MARAKKVVEEPKEEVLEPKEEVKESKSKVAGVYRNGVLQREYTPELHGGRFKELAAEFAGKHGYEVVVK